MATSITEEDISEWDILLREQKEILYHCISEAKNKLDEREAELTQQMEKVLKEDQKRFIKLTSDKQQLTSALEQLQITLTSESLMETGSEAVQLMQNKIKELEREKMKLQFNWSRNDLFIEISKVGEFVLTPVLTPYQLDAIDCNSKSECIALVHPPNKREQRTEILKLLNKPVQLQSSSYYLICMQWFNQWKRYVEYDENSCGSYPGPIDDTALLECGKLRKNLSDKVDYTLLPDPAWYKLVSWYGVTRGLVGIKRRVVRHGKTVKKLKVEVYPLELDVCMFPNQKDTHPLEISRIDTIDNVDKRLRLLFSITPKKPTQIYRIVKGLNSGFTFEPIANLKSQIQEVLLLQEDSSYRGLDLLIAVQNVNGSWPTQVELDRILLAVDKLH